MFRILGFILGSAASIAGILFVLGVPEINLPGVEDDQARFDAALEKIREKQPAVDEVVMLEPEEQESIYEVEATVAEPKQEDIAASADIESIAASKIEEATEQQDIFNPQQHWHEFWNPFRSELAARGFVSRLEKVTGLDYRVVKVKAGVYQVGFAYANDDERRVKISQISAATGLDLPQS